MFIQTEATPNPETLKFIPGEDVLGDGNVRDFSDVESAAASPLAAALFALGTVKRVFFGSDFITVTKTEGEWQHLRPSILGLIMDHYTSGRPMLVGEAAEASTQSSKEYDEEEAEIVDQIKELLDTRVRPAVAQDGGDIVFHEYDDGVVFLTMRGACAGCPSSAMTLKAGIENLLKHYVPEVTRVEQVEAY